MQPPSISVAPSLAGGTTGARLPTEVVGAAAPSASGMRPFLLGLAQASPPPPRTSSSSRAEGNTTNSSRSSHSRGPPPPPQHSPHSRRGQSPDELIAVAMGSGGGLVAFAASVRSQDAPVRPVRVHDRDLLWPVTSCAAHPPFESAANVRADDQLPPPSSESPLPSRVPVPAAPSSTASSSRDDSRSWGPGSSQHSTDGQDDDAAAAPIVTTAADAVASASEILGPFRLPPATTGGAAAVLLVCLFAAPYRQARLIRLRVCEIAGPVDGEADGGPHVEYHPDYSVVAEAFTPLGTDPALAEARLARALCKGALSGAAATLVSPSHLWIHGGAVVCNDADNDDDGGAGEAAVAISNAVVQLNLSTGRVSVAVNTSMTVPSPAVVGHAAHAAEGPGGAVLVLGGKSPDDGDGDEATGGDSNEGNAANLSRPVVASGMCIEPVDDLLVCTVATTAPPSCTWQYRRCLGDLPPPAVVSDAARTAATVMCGPWCLVLSPAAGAFIYALHLQRRVWVRLKYPPGCGRPHASERSMAPAAIAVPSAPGGAIVSFVNGAGHLISWAASGLIAACNARANAALDAAMARQSAAVPPPVRRAATPAEDLPAAHRSSPPPPPPRSVTPHEAARVIARLHTLDRSAQRRREDGVHRRSAAAGRKAATTPCSSSAASSSFPKDEALPPPPVVERLHVTDDVRKRQDKWRDEQLQRRQPLRQFPPRVNDNMFVHRFYERPVDHNRHRDRRVEASVDEKFSKVTAQSCHKTTDRPELWESLHEDRAHIHRLNKAAAKLVGNERPTKRTRRPAQPGAAEERLYAEGSAHRQRQAETLFAKYVVQPLHDASTPSRVRGPAQ